MRLWTQYRFLFQISDEHTVLFPAQGHWSFYDVDALVSNDITKAPDRYWSAMPLCENNYLTDLMLANPIDILYIDWLFARCNPPANIKKSD